MRRVVENGRATGVVTGQGESYRATESVVASVNPDQFYLGLLSGAGVPAPLMTQARGYRYGRGQVDLYLALWADGAATGFDAPGPIALVVVAGLASSAVRKPVPD